ncbi:pimeloyl-ACP methyl ester carboxylesterase [Amycolatopsis bartoniae]|uniref:Acetyltransferase n=1 Tax=Amycolatopsis bartoniae TaxID=941986 RepID=A0A8H9J3T4_9PSEU|nr:alpha/beta hydrolase [Amycolatopsis bartoniae]MBB2939368.1 pimeloyl-ACP methyl ester carboxylesterase [Amycolatopsis bartoniae]TVT06709.1 alpha/beta hydrolase [Amycolatopsis bartoniae]GHF83538.1 acetyltransferase [Amycolatopsis bartoniae]
MSTIEHTIDVPHLGGSVIGATFGRPYDPELPTLVMINSYTTSADLYRPQFADPALNGVVNLLALEPFGHGRTRAGYEHFTYWDSATANLQALAALGISEAFVLGTSQGGWIAVRMALMAPQVVKGLIPLGTSLDTESQRTRDLGCWDGPGFCTPFIDAFADSVDSDWVVPDQFVDDTFDAALGGLTHDERKFWLTTYRRNYAGDAGRHRLRLCTINLRDRDGLHGRLDEVRPPVLWLHGTADQVYSIANAEEEIKLLTRSADAHLEVIDGGHHFLSASKPDQVNAAAAKFIARWA